MNSTIFKKFKLHFLVFFTAFFAYFFLWHALYMGGINTLPIQSEDTVPAMFMPVTLLKKGTFFVNSYYDMMVDRYPHPDDRSRKQGLLPFYLVKSTVKKCNSCPPGKFCIQLCSSKNYLTAFTLTPGILATPFYAPFVLSGVQITWETLILMSHFASSGLMALSAVLMFVLLKKHFFNLASSKEQNIASLENLSTDLETNKKALILTAIYAFATVNFAMLSQSLWQHGPVQLFVIASLIFLLNAFKNQKPMQFALFGFFISLAVITRPTAALFAFLLYLLILINYKKKFIKPTFFTALGVLPVFAFFVWSIVFLYGGLENTGYASQMGNSWLSPIWEGFLGIWISPSKGILIYSPVLFFSLFGVYLVLKNKSHEKRAFYMVSFLIILIHTLIMARWKHWFGGFSFGYRLASDALPFFIMLLVPFVNSNLFKELTWRKVFYVLFAFSVAVQLYGMVFFDGIWHNAYDKGYKDTRWLWSLRDSEVMFNARRVLVKLGVLERACPVCLPD